jgi:hypothetical protein
VYVKQGREDACVAVASYRTIRMKASRTHFRKCRPLHCLSDLVAYAPQPFPVTPPCLLPPERNNRRCSTETRQHPCKHRKVLQGQSAVVGGRHRIFIWGGSIRKQCPG